MSNTSLLNRVAGGAFDQRLRAVLERLRAPQDIIDDLSALGREHTGKAALGAGAAGAAAGGGLGYYAGDRQARRNLTIDDIVEALQGGTMRKDASKVETVMSEFKKGKLRSGSKDGPKVKSRDQAVAIALSEAREAGEKVPAKKASDFLSAEERMQLMHSGAVLKCAELGISKEAQLAGIGEVFDAGTRAVVVASAVTGIPLGIMAHLMGKATRTNKLKEQELKRKAEFYQNAGQELERNLVNQGAQL